MSATSSRRWFLPCVVAALQPACSESYGAAQGAEEPAPIVATREPLPDAHHALVPLGDTSPELTAHLAASLERRFRMRVTTLVPMPFPPAAWYARRQRWRAEILLDILDTLEAGGAKRVTGITEAPISTTKGRVYDWGIAGLGTIGGKSSVLSAHYFRRLKKKQPTRYRRFMENLVLHEVGHTLGLDHCPLDRCIMADAKGNALRAAKASINEFCPRCTRLLGDHLRDPRERGRWSIEERLILDRLP